MLHASYHSRVIKPGWYASPDSAGSRWWTGAEWSSSTVTTPVVRMRRGRTLLLVASVATFLIGTLAMGPQAFGVVMANFDEHVIDAHAALAGLLGGAALAFALLVAGIATHRTADSAARWTAATYFLLGAIAIEVLSLSGATEHLGLLLFN